MFIKVLVIVLLIFLLTFNAEMALRTKAELETMDFSCQGQPFVEIPAKDSIDLETMDYSFQAQPFVRAVSTEVAGWSHKWNTKEFTKWNGLQ